MQVNEPGRINLADLTTPQLAELKQTLEQEVKVAQTQFDALQGGRTRFDAARDTMKKLHEAEGDSPEILIPLTTSVYQPGRLASRDRFVIDIGAGFFVERDYKKNDAYLNKRIGQVDRKLAECAEILGEKKRIHEAITAHLQNKIAASSPA